MTEPNAHAAHAVLGAGIHLPNGLTILRDVGAIFLAYKMGNLLALKDAAEQLLKDLGIKDPTPDD